MSLNNIIQFHTKECYISHQYMCRIPAMTALRPKKVLIIGGGDGFAAREFLKYPFIEEITNVELDADLIKITKNHPIMRMLTDNAFNNPRVKVSAGDGIGYLVNSKEKDDIIIDDCEYDYTGQSVDIKSEKEKKRYDKYLENLVTKLTPGGICCIMEPLIKVRTRKATDLASKILGINRFFIDVDGRILDHIRYSQEELREGLVEDHMNEDNDDLKFFRALTPHVTYKIFMSRMLGPEAYIYASNMPIMTRRRL